MGGQKEKSGLKMSELTSRTGVSKATVAHYVSLGLLPQPVKTAPNMAYYDPDAVGMIEIIRELREKQNLSLAAIKELLDKNGREGLQRIIAETEQMSRFIKGWLSDNGRSMDREAIIASSGIDPNALDELEKMGLVVEVEEGRYDSVSADLAMALGRMARLQLSDGMEYKIRDMKLYHLAIKKLVEKEMTLFKSRVLGKVPRDKARALLNSALESAEEVIVALRRRMLLDYLDRL